MVERRTKHSGHDITTVILNFHLVSNTCEKICKNVKTLEKHTKFVTIYSTTIQHKTCSPSHWSSLTPSVPDVCPVIRATTHTRNPPQGETASLMKSAWHKALKTLTLCRTCRCCLSCRRCRGSCGRGTWRGRCRPQWRWAQGGYL